jgi:hypothetical protein
MPSFSGMNQNQPCSNHVMMMLPPSSPWSRRALRKWPKIAALAWSGFLRLFLSRLPRNVSRPVASTTKRGRKASSLPAASVAVTVGPEAVVAEVHFAHAHLLTRIGAALRGVAEEDLVRTRSGRTW